MKIEELDETTGRYVPLEPSDEPQTENDAQIFNRISCLAVALPTAFLAGLSALSSTALQDVENFSDLGDLISESSPERIAYGSVVILSSESVLYFLNRRYLFPSCGAAIDLAKRTFTCKYKKGEGISLLGENILCAWSLVTSLIFAEIGSKAFEFMGTPGEIVGFTLNLLVYFSTRYAGANMFFRNAFDKNCRLKQKYIDRLEELDLAVLSKYTEIVEAVPIGGSHEDNVNMALARFLRKLDDNWDKLPKDCKNAVQWWTGKILGCGLVMLTVVPIMASFMPESIQGTEAIIRVDIGHDEHYQNAASFTYGTFSTALTLFFYELNIKDLPKHFLKTMEQMYKDIKEGNVKGAMKLLMLTLVAAGASYCTGLGFASIATAAISNGYLSYLGDTICSLIHDGLLVGVTTMLWSHLQDLISKIQTKKIAPSTTLQIDNSNVIKLLEHEKTNIHDALIMFQGEDHMSTTRKLQITDAAAEHAV